jgi:hypothetical protein
MKKAKKALTYKDFLQETLSDKPSKLYLSNADGITDLYLEVLSETHQTLKRAVILFSLAEQKVQKECFSKELDLDHADRVIYLQDNMIEPRKELASVMVVGGNFEDYQEVLDNPQICEAVVARSFDSGQYAIKK